LCFREITKKKKKKKKKKIEYGIKQAGNDDYNVYNFDKGR